MESQGIIQNDTAKNKNKVNSDETTTVFNGVNTEPSFSSAETYKELNLDVKEPDHETTHGLGDNTMNVVEGSDHPQFIEQGGNGSHDYTSIEKPVNKTTTLEKEQNPETEENGTSQTQIQNSHQDTSVQEKLIIEDNNSKSNGTTDHTAKVQNQENTNGLVEQSVVDSATKEDIAKTGDERKVKDNQLNEKNIEEKVNIQHALSVNEDTLSVEDTIENKSKVDGDENNTVTKPLATFAKEIRNPHEEGPPQSDDTKHVSRIESTNEERESASGIVTEKHTAESSSESNEENYMSGKPMDSKDIIGVLADTEQHFTTDMTKADTDAMSMEEVDMETPLPQISAAVSVCQEDSEISQPIKQSDSSADSHVKATSKAKHTSPEIMKVLTGLCPFDELPPLPKKVVRIFVSSTFTGKLYFIKRVDKVKKRTKVLVLYKFVNALGLFLRFGSDEIVPNINIITSIEEFVYAQAFIIIFIHFLYIFSISNI